MGTEGERMSDALRGKREVPPGRGRLHLLPRTAVSGVLLNVRNAPPAMPALLAVHLGFVLAPFLLPPCGKFVRGAYRALALLRHAREARTPNPVGLAEP